MVNFFRTIPDPFSSFFLFFLNDASSVADRDLNPDPYVFVPPGSGFISQKDWMQGSGSLLNIDGSGPIKSKS